MTSVTVGPPRRARRADRCRRRSSSRARRRRTCRRRRCRGRRRARRGSLGAVEPCAGEVRHRVAAGRGAAEAGEQRQVAAAVEALPAAAGAALGVLDRHLHLAGSCAQVPAPQRTTSASGSAAAGSAGCSGAGAGVTACRGCCGAIGLPFSTVVEQERQRRAATARTSTPANQGSRRRARERGRWMRTVRASSPGRRGPPRTRVPALLPSSSRRTLRLRFHSPGRAAAATACSATPWRSVAAPRGPSPARG